MMEEIISIFVIGYEENLIHHCGGGSSDNDDDNLFKFKVKVKQ
jgi:hypothetical protein